MKITELKQKFKKCLRMLKGRYQYEKKNGLNNIFLAQEKINMERYFLRTVLQILMKKKGCSNLINTIR